MSDKHLRPDYKKERKKRTEADLMSTVIKDKTGKTKFDGKAIGKKPRVGG